jgi:hypothetical protein
VALPLVEGFDDDGDGDFDDTREYQPWYRVGQFELRLSFGVFTVASVGSGQIRVVAVAGPSGFLRTEAPPPYDVLQRELGISLD